MMKRKATPKELTLKEKKSVIADREKGLSERVLADKYGVSKSQSFDREMKLEGRKVLLFLDNATSHADVTNVELVFFPPNMTSDVQPFDQGIIQCFKLLYRKQLMRHFVSSAEGNVMDCVTASNEEWIEFNTNFNQFLANGGDVYEHENAVELTQDETTPLGTSMRKGLQAMNELKLLCVENGHTDLYRFLRPAIGEAERLVCSNMRRKEITDYFTKK